MANLWKDFYIAEGFKDDCAELVRRCLRVKKLSYEKFCDIWKKMDFACVFYRCNSGAEVAEFSDETLHIAKTYLFAKTGSFEKHNTVHTIWYSGEGHRCLSLELNLLNSRDRHIEASSSNVFLRSAHYMTESTQAALLQLICHVTNTKITSYEKVAGLFLVYALLNLQPFAGFSPLKVINEDVECIQQIEQTARSQRRYDVLYILGSILIKGPCQYHVVERERGIEHSIRKYLDNSQKNQFCGGSRGVFSGQREELDLLRELKTLSLQYTKAKQAVSGSTTVTRNLSYTSEGAPSMLETSLKNVIYGFGKENNTENEGEKVADKNTPNTPPKENTSNTISSIKQRAMKTSINPMRHLTGIKERKDLGITSPRKSPQKPIDKTPSPTKTTRKRKMDKPSKIVLDSTDESDDHISLHDSDDSMGNIDEEDKEDNSVDSVNKDEPTSTNTIKIQVDTLPVLITAPNEKEFEIEIIDHQTNTKEVGKAKIVGRKKTNVPNVTKRVTRSSVKAGERKGVNKTLKKKKDSENFKKTLRKREKRDILNTPMASSFRRLGLLDIVKVAKKGNK